MKKEQSIAEQKFTKYWYILVVKSGCEDSVKATLFKRFENANMSNYLDDILIVKKQITNKLTKQTKIKNIYPSYIFIKIYYTKEIISIIYGTQNVVGFINNFSRSKITKPVPLSEADVKKIEMYAHKYSKDNQKTVFYKTNFAKGDKVRIISDNAYGGIGVIDSIDAEKGKAIVNVELFGRLIPTEFLLKNLEKYK